jgi:ubiquinone/menaquinone biosynthesis C-methylase UbiE
MGTEPPGGEHVERAARTYSAAADHFNDPALGFWDRYGTATVDRLPLAPGHRVLDLCCGTGASAIPAARAVGPSGQVIGIDAAGPLLALARDVAYGTATKLTHGS